MANIARSAATRGMLARETDFSLFAFDDVCCKRIKLSSLLLLLVRHVLLEAMHLFLVAYCYY